MLGICILAALVQQEGDLAFPDLPGWEFIVDLAKMKGLPNGTRGAYRSGDAWIAIARAPCFEDIDADSLAALAGELNERSRSPWEQVETREVVAVDVPAYVDFHQLEDRWRGLAMFRRRSYVYTIHARGGEGIRYDLIALLRGLRSPATARATVRLPFGFWSLFWPIFLMSLVIWRIRRRLA